MSYDNSDDDMTVDGDVTSDNEVPTSPPDKERRVHFHFPGGQGRVNIHEHMLYKQSPDWSKTLVKLYDDEKDEPHFEDSRPDAWLYPVWALWVYGGQIAKYDKLRAWKEEIPQEWTEGREAEPLAISLAIELATFASSRDWYGLYNQMSDFLLHCYQMQGIAPDWRRVQHVYKTDDSFVESIFCDLHFKYGGSDWRVHLDNHNEIERWPSKFLFALVCHAAEERDRKAVALKGTVHSPRGLTHVQLYDSDGTIALRSCDYH